MRIVLGIGFEIAAFTVFLVSELIGLPLSFAFFIHLTAVFFFTRGLDGKLIEINLRRELCFFFSLFFPLAGMAGMLFYVFILKKIEHLIVLPFSQAAVAPPPLKKTDAAAYVEEDQFRGIPESFIRRLPYALCHKEILLQPANSFLAQHCREEDYVELERELAARLESLKQSVSQKSETPLRLELAEAFLAYAASIRIDPALRRRYLQKAESLCEESGDDSVADQELLAVRIEIAFQKDDYRRCLALYDALKKKSNVPFHVQVRVGECLLRLKEYRRLAVLAREINSRSGAPERLKELTALWYNYG